MDKKDRDRLQEKRVFLLDNIGDDKSLIDGLFSRKIFTPRVMDDIMAEKTKTDRLRALLDTLPRKGARAFQALLDVLVENEEYDAAVALCPELADKCKALNAGSVSQLQPHHNLHSLAENPDELPEVWPLDNLQTVTVIPVTDETMKTKYASAAKDAFSLQNGRVLLIINNSEFSPGSNLRERIGSEKDEEALEKLFHQLDFEVIVRRNLSAEYKVFAPNMVFALTHVDEKGSLHFNRCLEMLQDVSEVCKRQPISCFACAILSHGGKACIFGVDGKEMFLSDLLHVVSNEKSPNLKGKPKLFFIQACQGKNYVVVEGNQADASLEKSTEENLEDSVEEDANNSIAEIDDDIEKALGIIEADGPMASARTREAFIAMATVPDFVSFRHTTLGSWFIQAVVFVISKLAHKMELNHLMLRVNRLVGRARAGGYGQIAVFKNTMTKEFYFFPGLLKR